VELRFSYFCTSHPTTTWLNCCIKHYTAVCHLRFENMKHHSHLFMAASHVNPSLYNVRFQVLMVASKKMTAFCDIAPCTLIQVDWCFRWRQYTSETSVYFYETTEWHNPEGRHLLRYLWLSQSSFPPLFKFQFSLTVLVSQATELIIGDAWVSW
jgi:hypothetical protein